MFEFEKRRLGCIPTVLELYDLALDGDGVALLRAYVGDHPPGLADLLLASMPQVETELLRFEEAVQRASEVASSVATLTDNEFMPEDRLKQVRRQTGVLAIMLQYQAAIRLMDAVRQAVAADKR